MQANSSRLLGIYLNDHLAGSTAGVELARRLVGENEENATFAAPLRTLRDEIEADKDLLERLMGELGIRRSPVKPLAAWLGEKLGRLKPNGQLRGYSPLSRLVGIEMLCLGITGKRQMWQELEATGPEIEGFDFPALAERAAGQRSKVEELHLKAGAIAFRE